MLEYRIETIKNIIDKINVEYFLPDIQRSFVWKPLQIYKLFDSIMRPYPISTFLFWELDRGFVKRESIKLLEFAKSNREDNKLHLNYKRDKYYLVLDGQQRLSSFYIALKGTYWERNKEKELYFNALSGKELIENDLLYEFKFFTPDKGDCSIEENKSYGIQKIWINVKRIYEIPSGKAEDIRNFVNNVLKRVINNMGLLKYTDLDEVIPPEIRDTVFDNVHNLYYYLTSEPVINYYPERRQDYDAVLDIFVRTNAGGTKLTYSDLLFSKIKRQWNEAREKFKGLLEEINGNVFDFDGDFILKTCLVIFSKKQKDVRYRIENVDKEKINLIRRNWDKISRSIKITVNIVKNYLGLTTSKLLPSHNALIPVVYFIYKNNIRAIANHGHNSIPNVEVEKIKQWLYRVLLTGVFGGQSDSVLFKTKEVIEKAETLFPSLELNRQIQSIGKSLEINEDFLNEIRYNSTDSYLLLFLLYKNEKLKLDFNPVFKGETPQQDHVFSQNELKDAGYSESDRNDIGNIRYITASENQRKSNIPFSKWITQISEEEKKIHLIPPGDWNLDRYPLFLKERKKLMLERLRLNP